MATISAPATSCPGERAQHAIRVPSLRLQRILGDAGVGQVDALKIDVEGYEDRVLTGFFSEAPQALWPRAVVIEHLSRDEWLDDCIADMLARGYAETGKTRSNTLLVRGSSCSRFRHCSRNIAASAPLSLRQQWSDHMANDNTARDVDRAWDLMKKIGFAMLVTATATSFARGR